MVQKVARWLLAKPSIDSQPTMQLAKLVLTKLFPRIQLGLHRAGSERYYRLQAFLEKQQNDCVAMFLDIKNAFNTRSCVKMAESLFSTPSTHPIWHLFHWAYCDSSHLNLYYQNGEYKGTIYPKKVYAKATFLPPSFSLCPCNLRTRKLTTYLQDVTPTRPKLGHSI
jgi:hypothetical protein